MVSSTVRNDDTVIEEDIDISHEKHRKLLETITSKTKRKYTIYFIKLLNLN